MGALAIMVAIFALANTPQIIPAQGLHGSEGWQLQWQFRRERRCIFRQSQWRQHQSRFPGH